MDFSFFIAKKLAFSKKSTFSSSIIKIAIVAVAVSTAVMIISVFMIRGFQVGISEKVFGFWGHIDIYSGQSTREISITPLKDYSNYIEDLKGIGQIEYQTLDNATRLTKGGVKHVQKYILYPAILKTKTDYDGMVLKGVGEDFYRENMQKYLKQGEFPYFGKDSVRDKIVISKFTADRLNLKVGDKVISNFFIENNPVRKRLIISGIYNTGLAEYDKKLAFIDIRLLTKILGWQKDEIGGMEVFVDNIEDLDVLNEYIYVEILPSDIYSMTIKQKFPAIFEWLQLQNINEEVILLLMLIVSIINMITSLLILILERTNMIGILRSMGASTWSMRKIFLFHASYIIIFGLILGNILGIGFSLLQKHYGIIKLDEASYYLSQAPIYFDWGAWLLINIGTLILTFISLIIPSYLVSKIDPVKAIMFR
jgi:lipoprotein-releasing system permease protein